MHALHPVDGSVTQGQGSAQMQVINSVLKSPLPTSSPPYLTTVIPKGRAGEDAGVKSKRYHSSPETHRDEYALHPIIIQ